jgi:hypothetical protein
MECQILDYRPFERGVPFKDAAGVYAEAGGATSGYYQAGVRRISTAEFEAILKQAQIAAPEVQAIAGDVPAVGARFNTSEIARQVEEYAVARARADLIARYPHATVRAMPRNNPGFDLAVVGADGATIAYVEVKGTALPAPVFFLSEGERRFSGQESERYELIVVYGIDLEEKTHTLVARRGEITTAEAALSPVTWRGRLSI